MVSRANCSPTSASPRHCSKTSRFRQLSTDARTLYGILLDRMSLSVKNGWLDEQGRVYIIYTGREVQESLCCAEHKAVKLFRELEEHRPHRAQTPWAGQTQPDLRQGLFLRTCPKRKYRIAQTAILVLPKAQFWNSQNRKQIRLIRIKQSGTILTLSIPGASGSSLRIIFVRHWR